MKQYPVESILSARQVVSPQLAGDYVYFVSDMSGIMSLYRMKKTGSFPERLLPAGLQNSSWAMDYKPAIAFVAPEGELRPKCPITHLTTARPSRLNPARSPNRCFAALSRHASVNIISSVYLPP